MKCVLYLLNAETIIIQIRIIKTKPCFLKSSVKLLKQVNVSKDQNSLGGGAVFQNSNTYNEFIFVHFDLQNNRKRKTYPYIFTIICYTDECYAVI